jgi:beta-N-acetylhexosaminidase
VLSGGRQALDSLEVFDLARGGWANGPALPVGLHGLPAAAVDGRLYLLGGSDRAGGIDNHGRVLSISLDALQGSPSTSAGTEPPPAPTGSPAAGDPQGSGTALAGVAPPASVTAVTETQPSSVETATPSASASSTAPAVPTAAVQAGDWVEAALAGMSLEQKIGQMLVISLDGEQLSPEMCQLVQGLAPGGVIYGWQNVANPHQVRSLSAGLQGCAEAAGSPPLLLTLDHEGQYINRFDEVATMFPAALALGAAGDPELAGQVALAAGRELAYSGVNMVLGPVADVLLDYDNGVVSQRTFGGDTELVSRFVARSVSGYREAGVIAALKHFPGHGGVAGDSHDELPVDQADLPTLESAYLPPFRSGIEAGAQVVMFAHVAYPRVSGSELPATHSLEIVRLLRQGLGFQGIIISDAMNMKGVTGGGKISVQKASLEAVKAGVDLLLITAPGQVQRTYDFLLDAAREGDLPAERVDSAVRYILNVKAASGLSAFPLPQPPEPDWQANANLALEAGRRSLTLYYDDAGVVPLPAGVQKILVIAPESDWEFYPILEAALAQRVADPEFVYYPEPWSAPVDDGGALEALPAKAAGADLVLFFTWQVHLNRVDFDDDWQSEMAQRLVDTGKPVVIVSLKSPTDLLGLPRAAAFLAMFGTTTGQSQALLDALTGSWEPVGQNPLPNLVK